MGLIKPKAMWLLLQNPHVQFPFKKKKKIFHYDNPSETKCIVLEY